MRAPQDRSMHDVGSREQAVSSPLPAAAAYNHVFAKSEEAPGRPVAASAQCARKLFTPEHAPPSSSDRQALGTFADASAVVSAQSAPHAPSDPSAKAAQPSLNQTAISLLQCGSCSSSSDLLVLRAPRPHSPSCPTRGLCPSITHGKVAPCPMTLRRPVTTFERPTPRRARKLHSSAWAWRLPMRRQPSCEWVAIRMSSCPWRSRLRPTNPRPDVSQPEGHARIVYGGR